MYTGEVINTREPQTEKLVGPSLSLKNLKSQDLLELVFYISLVVWFSYRVIVNSVNNHLHEVNPVRLDFDLGVCKCPHRHLDLFED